MRNMSFLIVLGFLSVNAQAENLWRVSWEGVEDERITKYNVYTETGFFGDVDLCGLCSIDIPVSSAQKFIAVSSVINHNDSDVESRPKIVNVEEGLNVKIKSVSFVFDADIIGP